MRECVNIKKKKKEEARHRRVCQSRAGLDAFVEMPFGNFFFFAKNDTPYQQLTVGDSSETNNCTL